MLVVFGIVSGVAAGPRCDHRRAGGHRLKPSLEFDQSYSFAGIPALGIPSSEYDDTLGTVTDCDRQMFFWGVDGPDDQDDGG